MACWKEYDTGFLRWSGQMPNNSCIHVFGEVLYDCFPEGEEVLGGAPFNVAWHLQALGDKPRFISRIGDDKRGHHIQNAMGNWGLSTEWLQIDPEHPTGTVKISIQDNEPSYDIRPDAAYDFIQAESLPLTAPLDIIYHGSLALRNSITHTAFSALSAQSGCARFMDINLRDPWWSKQSIDELLRGVRWAKMNQAELNAIGFTAPDIRENMRNIQERYSIEECIVTRGPLGTVVRTMQGEIYESPPPPLDRRVDTVGAGDSFSAIYLHGISSGWSIPERIERAQQFANHIIGIRGATPNSQSFYSPFI